MKDLTDTAILDLYETRSESAIEETKKQYGAFCTAIAMRILHNKEDCEECVADTMLKAWNAIPPARPNVLSAFLAKIVKNLALDRYKAKTSQKRAGESGEVALMLSELEECVPCAENVESVVDSRILKESIAMFLTTVSVNDKAYFMRRYWYNESIAEIADRFSASESKVMSSLFRTRNKLKSFLEKEGYTL